MTKYMILIVGSFIVLFSLADGIFALSSPEAWLRSRWTAKRGLPPGAPVREVRTQGITHIVVGVVAASMLYRSILSMLGG
jgi:hypothetical protein